MHTAIDFLHHHTDFNFPVDFQVLEPTARLIESQGIKCVCRGMTFVKGKGEVITYFVPTDEEFNLLSNESSVTSLYESNSDQEESSL
jgi:hypothetical protein